MRADQVTVFLAGVKPPLLHCFEGVLAKERMSGVDHLGLGYASSGINSEIDQCFACRLD